MFAVDNDPFDGPTMIAQAEKLLKAKALLLKELRSVIMGQDRVIEELMIAFFARGHCLIEGVPGLAKTLLISSLSQALDLKFSRIQFTPDLMPADITGSEILEEDPHSKARAFRFLQGPVFANIILADEINRTPPKTQAALLQAMQEYHVTAGGQTRPLPLPFFVMATQNPIEQEGTYPLPEAQLDRFFMQILVDYPSAGDEERIVAQTTGGGSVELRPSMSSEEVLVYQDLLRRVPAPPGVVRAAVTLARRSRPQEPGAAEAVKKWVAWGSGPRGSQALVLAAKARAILSGRFAASVEDVAAMALPVLRHRVLLNFEAQAEGVKADRIIAELLSGL